MANNATPYGADLIGILGNSEYNASIRKFIIPDSDSTAVFLNDFVKLTGDASDDGIAYVAQAAAGDAIVGVVAGFEPNRNDLTQLYRPASQERIVYVNVNPYVEFNIKTSNGTLAPADIGLNADIAVAAGNTTSGISGMSLDLGTKTASSAQIRIEEVSQIPNNEVGDYTQVRAFINEHAFKATAGV